MPSSEGVPIDRDEFDRLRQEWPLEGLRVDTHAGNPHRSARSSASGEPVVRVSGNGRHTVLNQCPCAEVGARARDRGYRMGDAPANLRLPQRAACSALRRMRESETRPSAGASSMAVGSTSTRGNETPSQVAGSACSWPCEESGHSGGAFPVQHAFHIAQADAESKREVWVFSEISKPYCSKSDRTWSSAAT